MSPGWRDASHGALRSLSAGFSHRFFTLVNNLQKGVLAWNIPAVSRKDQK
jgi:hypothetical protein